MSRLARLAAAGTACLLGVALLGMPASAADDVRILDKGWWWRLQTGALTTVPPPPDVDPGELMVQGEPQGAQAIAAIAFELAEGHTAPTLTLTVAEGGDQGGEAAVLLACQAGAGWTGAEAARWDTAPVADCSQSVAGIRSDDGGAWTFPVASLQFGRQVNVILVPGLVDGAPEGLDGSTFRLVFEEPTASSVTTVDGSPPPTTAPPPPPIAGFDGGDLYVPPSSYSPGGGSDFVAGPVVVAAEPALEPDLQGQTATAPRTQESTKPVLPAVAEEESRAAARIVGLIVLLGGLVYGFLTWRRPLVAAPGGSAASGSGADGAMVGGLGRFRRERGEEPAPVS